MNSYPPSQLVSILINSYLIKIDRLIDRQIYRYNYFVYHYYDASLTDTITQLIKHQLINVGVKNDYRLIDSIILFIIIMITPLNDYEILVKLVPINVGVKKNPHVFLFPICHLCVARDVFRTLYSM